MPAAAPITAPVGGAIPAVPPAARPPPTTTVITPAAVPAPVQPLPPPKAGSARARMEAKMDKMAAHEPAAATPPTSDRPGAQPSPDTSPETPSPESSETPEPGSTATEPGSTPETSAAPEAGTQPPPEAGKGKKVSPWKLVDEYKDKLAKAEQEISTLKSSVLPEADRTKMEERVKSAETRAAELEEHIRYVDYTKSKEFTDKFQAPYEAAWKRQMGNLKDIMVPLENGSSRPFGSEDLVQLAGMERGQARKVAEELFGADADDVLAARLEVRRLWDEREAGLAEAKKSGSERVQNAQQQLKASQEAVQKAVKETWDKVNATLIEDPEIGALFKPRDNDQDWNQLLAKGFQLVDNAFSQDPRDPRLTPDQRAAIVKRHAAVRNRAASWGAIRYELGQIKAKLEAAEKTLAGYKKSSPPAGGTTPSTGTTASSGRAIDRVMGALDRLAVR